MKVNKRLTLVPKPKFYNSIRNLGYSNYEAICDIIDNSIDKDVNAENIFLNVDKDMSKITIADDGRGMTISELEDALNMGSKGKTVQTDDLGLFGCGLKTSALSIGKCLEIITKTFGGDYLTAIYDIEEFISLGKASPLLRNSSKEEIDFFKKTLKNKRKGTIISIKNLDRLQNHNKGSFISRLKEHISKIYKYILKEGKIKIFIGSRKVEPMDTMLEQKKGVLYNESIENQEYNFKFKDNGKNYDINLKLKFYYLGDYNRGGGFPYPSLKNQGFFVFRNNRQIIEAETLGIYNKHPDFNSFRCELFFEGGLDELFNVSLQKNKIVLPDSLVESLKKELTPIFMSFRNFKKNRKEEVEDEEELNKTLEDLEKEINKSNKLISPKEILKDLDTRDKVQRDKRIKIDKKEIKEDKPSTNITRKSLNIINLSHSQMGSKGDIFNILNKGNGVLEVVINTDHSFFKDFYSELPEQHQKKIIFTLFSLGRASEEQVTSLETNLAEAKREEFLDFIERFSNTYRKMYNQIFS